MLPRKYILDFVMGKKHKGDRFVALPYTMVESKAFKELSCTAVRIFIELKKRFNGSNNGHIFLSIREAKKICHAGQRSVSRAFEDLVLKGFIKFNKRGAFTYRKATTYYLTCEKINGYDKTDCWKQYPKNDANINPQEYIKNKHKYLE